MVDAFGPEKGSSMAPHSVWQDVKMGKFNQMHFLRDPGQSPADAVRKYVEFVEQNLNSARSLAQSNDKMMRYHARDFFTAAVHAIVDSRSPVHNENGIPQIFDPAWGVQDALAHGHSPFDSKGDEGTDDLTAEVQSEIVTLLRAAKQYVYDNGPMPNVVPPMPNEQSCGAAASCGPEAVRD